MPESKDIEYIIAYSVIVFSYAALVYSKMLRDGFTNFTYFNVLTGSGFVSVNENAKGGIGKIGKSIFQNANKSYSKK